MRFTVSVALLAAVALPAYSQDAEEMVVTATRFPEDASRLPASVTVITPEEIANSTARTLPELLSDQVGITMTDFFGNNAAVTGIDMRGSGVTGGQNTLILVNGQRVSDIDLSSVQWSAIPLSSIERVEVLRGVGAVLYGDGASTGVINIVTRSPLKQGASIDAHGRAATFDTQEGQVTASMVKDNFGINATAYTFRSDGYRENNFNKQDNYSAGMRWVHEGGYIDLQAAQDHQELRLPGARTVDPSIGLNEYLTDPRGTDTPLDYSSRDGHRAALTVSHDFGKTEVLVGLNWRDKDARAYFDQAGFPSFSDADLNVTGITPRVRIPFTLAGMNNRLTTGIDYYQWNYTSNRTTLPQFINQPTNRIQANQTNSAFYLQDEVAVTKATGLTLGWRTETVKISATDTLDPNAPGFFFNTAAAPASSNNTQTAWELGLKHQFTPSWSGYVRDGRSYRFANVDEIYGTDANFNAQFHMLLPQHQTTQEVGVEWKVSTASAKAALFRTDVIDEIHLDPFTPGVGNTNLDPSRRQGLELSGTWQPIQTLRLSGAYAYTDARFLQGTFAGAFPPFVNVQIGGNYVPLVPQNKINTSFVWNAAARTTVSGDANWQSSMFMDNDEGNNLGTKIPGFTVFNLKAAQSFDLGRVALSVNNLFNEKYYSYAVRSNFTADRYAVYPLPGRTVALALELKM